MDNKNKLTDLHKESLEKLEQYVNAHKLPEQTEQAKIKKAKDDWQYAWNQLMETLLILERLEI